MKLDLTQGKQFNNQVREIFNAISDQSRHEFTNLIGEMSQNPPLKNNLDWWVQSPASRNTLSSPLFYHFCIIRLVDYLIKNNILITEITVDSVALKIILNKILKKNSINIIIYGPTSGIKKSINIFLKNINTVYITFLRMFYKLKCAKKTKSFQKPLHDGFLTLIDVFVFPGYISKDRYYNALLENLSNTDKLSIYFVPTLTNIPQSDISLAYKELRQSERNFLIKEDYLGINDILFSIFHFFRLYFLRIYPVYFLGVNISLLIKEELITLNEFSGSVDALLNYRFARSLRKNRIRLRLVVDWFENQVVDKGWNSGFAQFYSNIRRVGYLGFIPNKSYLCLFPSKFENSNNVLPSEFVVIGPKLIQSINEFDSSINLNVGPAFRFHYLWDEHYSNSDSSIYVILIVLPGIEEHAISLLKSLKYSISKTDNTNKRYYIKSHPILDNDFISSKIKSAFPRQITIIQESFSQILFKSNLLITSGVSTAIYESFACGIPAIIYENQSGINFSSKPNNVPKQIWRYCKTPEDISNSIQYFSGLSENQMTVFKKIGVTIKNDYFKPINKETVYKFLKLPT